MADRHRLTGGMLLLTVLGAMLILPPAVYLFSHPVSHFGIPQIVFYIFVVWLLLIIGTALLARALPPDEHDTDPGKGEH